MTLKDEIASHERTGISVSELIRAATLGYRPPPSKIGSRRLGESARRDRKNRLEHQPDRLPPERGTARRCHGGSIESAPRELDEWRTALMQSLGAERGRKTKD